MRYSRPTERRTKAIDFPAGYHDVRIADVTATTAKNKETQMFVLKLIGSLSEVGYYNLTFGNSMTDENIGFILASIEDHGVEIPDIDFAYNRQTVDFLNGKQAYIKVTTERYRGTDKGRVDEFVTAAEFNKHRKNNDEAAESVEADEADLNF
ncbi:hypothetical protein WOSG25_090240 [Weissella oryzae SG25]|uniref:Uncharacterized protein n=1 Tax=Weissella oryzae (strain DSM 25784 / JCM 18191 / LMG 30913 / SG25) TaxID=1329250 RepID=A0A069CVD5_WEIOS|nr:hypothetical protein [Weissella oryzae]GAK31327.1 hypothetical protein WOSG25_090240 [Weissella oryzae SG25]